MRIALVSETFPPEVNGVAMTNRRLVDGLARRGHEIQVVRPRQKWEGSGATDTSFRELTVPGLPIPGYREIQFGLPVVKRLARNWKGHRPDVVHLATEGPLGFSALQAARGLEIPVSSAFHTNFQSYCSFYCTRFLCKSVMRYLRWFHNRCATTLVPSQYLLEDLEGAGFENLQLLGRGVDRDLFNPARRSPALRQSWGAAPEDPVAVIVSRVAPEKNIPLAIEAFRALQARAPEVRMVIVGDGPVRNKLQRTHPDIRFAGMRHGADLAAHYASGDIFLFASNTETYGNVVPEALASGLVVLTYDYAAGAGLIRHGGNGFLVPPNNRLAFIGAAAGLIDLKADWPRIRNEARRSTRIIPWTSVIRKFEVILRDVIVAHSPNLSQIRLTALSEEYAEGS